MKPQKQNKFYALALVYLAAGILAGTGATMIFIGNKDIELEKANKKTEKLARERDSLVTENNKLTLEYNRFLQTTDCNFISNELHNYSLDQEREVYERNYRAMAKDAGKFYLENCKLKRQMQIASDSINYLTDLYIKSQLQISTLEKKRAKQK